MCYLNTVNSGISWLSTGEESGHHCSTSSPLNAGEAEAQRRRRHPASTGTDAFQQPSGTGLVFTNAGDFPPPCCHRMGARHEQAVCPEVPAMHDAGDTWTC